MALQADGGGGGGISVVTSSLTSAGQQVKTVAGQVQECGASGALNACVSTGAPALDSVLSQFDMNWSTTVDELGKAGVGLSSALTSASTAYELTDSCAMPPGG
jgi:hypothetical protein